VTFDDVRKIALAWPEVDDGTSYGTPALRVRKKLLARLKEDGDSRACRETSRKKDRWQSHSGMVRSTRPQMRNCASGNLEIPGSMLTHRPGMTVHSATAPHRK
jgi:hypothetical protein